MKRLEPDEGKLSSPVLRGGNGGNVVSLPDTVPCDPSGWVTASTKNVKRAVDKL